MKFIILLSLFFLISINIYPQTSKENEDIISLGNLKLRNSFEDNAQSSKPAELTFSNPKNGEKSFLINAAIGYNINLSDCKENSSKLFFKLIPEIEYHRNNLAKNEQNLLSGGMAVEWIRNNMLEHPYTPIINSKINYNYNILNKTESIFLSAYYSFEYNKNNLLKYFLPSSQNPSLCSLIAYKIYPQFGLEYENKFYVEKNDIKGVNSCLMGKILFSSLPLFKLTKRFEIQVDYTYRYNFILNSLVYNRHLNIFNFCFNIILYNKNDKTTFKIGADYTKGNDPTKSIVNQDLWKITFKAKI